MNRGIEYHIKEPNRNTTTESLEAALTLITTRNKKEFIAAYKTAFHDDNGKSCIYYMAFYANQKYRGEK